MMAIARSSTSIESDVQTSGAIVITGLILVLVGLARLFHLQPDRRRRNKRGTDRGSAPHGPDPTLGFRDPFR
jgi:hypothetical protein